VRVPEEVKVAGIDNAPFTEFCVVPITSVSQRLIERGRLAVEMMERLVSGGKVDSVSLPAQVRERASTA
jgi:DNA-binding LacI/PurR family transcriptional regulator